MRAEQFIKDQGLERARGVVEGAPEGAEFYHADNNEYVKNIDQEHLQKAQAEPKESHLVCFDSSSSEGWIENAAWIEYINVLIDIRILKRLVESVDLVNTYGGIESCKQSLYMLHELTEDPQPIRDAVRDYESIYGEGNE